MRIKLRSCIKTAFKKRCVQRASFFGGIGAIGLVAAGSFMPLETLSLWGLPLLILAGGLITWAMLPYRRIAQLEQKPEELWINSKNDLVYSRLGRPVLTIPKNLIEDIFYVSRKDAYGIAVTIKNPSLEKIRIHLPSLNFSRLRAESKRLYGCDLFFPFFSESSYRELREYLFIDPTE